jgi:hypothetical protein
LKSGVIRELELKICGLFVKPDAGQGLGEQFALQILHRIDRIGEPVFPPVIKSAERFLIFLLNANSLHEASVPSLKMIATAGFPRSLL